MNANQTPAPVYISFATGSSNLFVEVFEFLSGSRERVLPCGISISMEAEVVGKRTKLFWWKATLGLFLFFLISFPLQPRHRLRHRLHNRSSKPTRPPKKTCFAQAASRLIVTVFSFFPHPVGLKHISDRKRLPPFQKPSVSPDNTSLPKPVAPC
ncbi:hypothetical protein HDK77DRAFT_245430 [Phyllosticta capitalensis]